MSGTLGHSSDRQRRTFTHKMSTVTSWEISKQWPQISLEQKDKRIQINGTNVGSQKLSLKRSN